MRASDQLLNRLANPGSPGRRIWASDYRDAWEDHLRLLSNRMPEMVRAEDSRDKIRVEVQPERDT